MTGRRASTVRDDAAAPPAAGPSDAARTILAFPRTPPAGRPAQPLADRLVRAARGRAAPLVLPAEAVTLLTVALPVQGRRRMQALPFAAEDRIAAPLDAVHVALGPAADAAAPDGPVLAAVLSRTLMAQAAASDGAVLPETLAIPAPPSGPDGAPAWAVWREGLRAVVRASDGTGFAVAADALPTIWDRAGRPPLVSYGAALPASLPARDLSADPPPPDPRDLAFDLRQGAFAPRSAGWASPLRAACAVAVLGFAGHLAIAAADLMALRGIAVDERATAQAAIDPLLPGVTVTADAAPILARLRPRPAAPQGSDFLPLLSAASQALLAGAPPVTLRRLAWGAQDGTLTATVQATGLEDLQQAERAIAAGGLRVRSGAATAGEGGAEVTVAVRRGEDR